MAQEKEKKTTKLNEVREWAKTLITFHVTEIATACELPKNNASAMLSVLKLRGEIHSLGPRSGRYRWNDRMPDGQGVIIIPPKEHQLEANTDSNIKSPTTFQETIKQITTNLDWLCSYVKQLESENQSLYEALSKHSNFAEATRLRYEDRLAAIIETNKKRKGN